MLLFSTEWHIILEVCFWILSFLSFLLTLFSSFPYFHPSLLVFIRQLLISKDLQVLWQMKEMQLSSLSVWQLLEKIIVTRCENIDKGSNLPQGRTKACEQVQEGKTVLARCQEVFQRVPTCVEAVLWKDTLDSKDGQGQVMRAKIQIANKFWRLCFTNLKLVLGRIRKAKKYILLDPWRGGYWQGQSGRNIFLEY